MLASTVALTPGAASRLLINGGNEANDYVISFDKSNGRYRIEDRSGAAMTTTQLLTGLDLNSASNIVEFDVAAANAQAVFQRIQIDPGRGDDTITVNSMRNGFEGLAVFNQTNQGEDTLNINTDIGSALAPVTLGDVLLRAEHVNLRGNVYTANEPFALGGTSSVTIPSNLYVDVGTAGASFEVPLDSASNVEVHSRLTIFSGAVQLESLEVHGSEVRGTDIHTNGDMLLHVDKVGTINTVSGEGKLTVQRFTAANQTYRASDLSYIQPGFSSILIGSELTTRLVINSDGNMDPVTGGLNLGAPLELAALEILILENINQEAFSTTLTAQNSISFSGHGSILGTGDLSIHALSGTASLSIRGNVGFDGSDPWVTGDLNVTTPGVDVTFTGQVGSSFRNIRMTALSLGLSHPTAVTAVRGIDLTADTINLSGGAYSEIGDLHLTGHVVLTGNVLFRVPDGAELIVDGDVDANGYNVIVRGRDGAARIVEFKGSVIDARNFYIDSQRESTASQVDLQDVSAAAVLVYGRTIDLRGDISSSANVSLVGMLRLHGNIGIQNGGTAKQLIQLIGNIDSAPGEAGVLTINTRLGRLLMTGTVGQTSALRSLIVTTGGDSKLTTNITVQNEFNWNNGGGSFMLTSKAVIRAGSKIRINAGVCSILGTLIENGKVITIH